MRNAGSARRGCATAVDALLARDPAGHAARFDDADGVIALLDALRAAGAPDQVDALAARSAHVLVNQYGDVALLVVSMWGTAFQDRATVLAAHALHNLEQRHRRRYA